MTNYGRRIVIDAPFEVAVGDTSRAIRDEGLQVIGRYDVRAHFWRDLQQDFRQYALIEAWSSDLAWEALQHDLDVGAILPTRFAVYELADGETAILATEPLSPLSGDLDFRSEIPALSDIADQETDRIARVLDRLERMHARKRMVAVSAA